MRPRPSPPLLAALLALAACVPAPKVRPDAGPLDAAVDAGVAPPLDAGVDAGADVDAGERGDAASPGVARLAGPAVVALPATVAGAGGSSATFALVNEGDGAVEGLVVALEGDPSITVDPLPARLAASSTLAVTLRYAGAAAQRAATATLRVRGAGVALDVTVHAGTLAAGIGPGRWRDLDGPRGARLGRSFEVALPTAPFPQAGAPWTDPTVHVFVPEGFRDRGVQDVAVHYHGWRATVSETLTTHRYREQLFASGANALLVVPQGPVNAESGNFGRLMSPGGLTALVEQVLLVLFREGAIAAPYPGEVLLTTHSGGYQAVAAALLSPADSGPVRQVHLYDALYAQAATFRAFVRSGGRLVSNHTPGGGTRDDNLAARAALVEAGVEVADRFGFLALRDAPAVIWPAETTHDGATLLFTAYGEALRWGAPHHRRGPRVELVSARAVDGRAELRWRSPPEEDLEGFVAERLEGDRWVEAARVGPDADAASFPLAAGARVRVVPAVRGVTAPLSSDVARLDPAPEVLVVDGLDRLIAGSLAALSHDLAARVGEATGRPVAHASDEAVAEGVVRLEDFRAVVWLLGDTSTGDHSVTASERAAIARYLEGGGHLVLSGSEVGFDLRTPAAAFLADLGVVYAADDARTEVFAGAGPLASLGRARFGGPGAAYDEEFPDVFTAAAGATGVLRYEGGGLAAAGRAGRAVVVGFPLELVEEAQRGSVVQALLGFVEGPR
jgi:hypothetical protein